MVRFLGPSSRGDTFCERNKKADSNMLSAFNGKPGLSGRQLLCSGFHQRQQHFNVFQADGRVQ